MKGTCFRTSRRHLLMCLTPHFLCFELCGFSKKPTTYSCVLGQSEKGPKPRDQTIQHWQHPFHLLDKKSSLRCANHVLLNQSCSIEIAMEFILGLSLGEANERGAFYWSAHGDYLLFHARALSCFTLGWLSYREIFFKSKSIFMDPKHSGVIKLYSQSCASSPVLLPPSLAGLGALRASLTLWERYTQRGDSASRTTSLSGGSSSG